MGIAQGFGMDLYCDNKNHPSNYVIYGLEGSKSEKYIFLDKMRTTFTGYTASECRKYAREEGWKFDLKKHTVLCPFCRKFNIPIEMKEDI